MQLIKFILALVILFVSGSATSVRAAEVPVAQTESALKQADQKLAAKEKAARRYCANYGSPTKTRQSIHCTGPARAKRERLKMQRKEVQHLLDQLEAGRPVDPTAVDRVLREAGVSMP